MQIRTEEYWRGGEELGSAFASRSETECFHWTFLNDAVSDASNQTFSPPRKYLINSFDVID